MKAFSIFLITLFITITGYSQKYIIQVKDAEKRKWSYINLKGEYISSEFYKKCFEFDESGYAVVFDNRRDQYFFIDENGKILETEIKGFNLKNVLGLGVKGFVDGYAAVEKKDRWGFIDTEGRLIIDCKYEKVNVMNEGLSAVRLDKKWLIIDKNGNERSPEPKNIEDIRMFIEGAAPFKTSEEKMGFLDQNGNILINPVFDNLGYFSGGIAWARASDAKIGYIDKKGNWLIAPQFLSARKFDIESGIARVKTIEGWIYIDRAGNKLNLNLSNKKKDFSEGLCAGNSGEFYGFYNSENRWVISPQFDAVRDFKNGYAAVKKDGLWGIINKKGEWIITPRYLAMKDVEIINY